MNIESKTILITGASRGLGANFSKVLAFDGFKILGVGRNKKNLETVICVVHYYQSFQFLKKE